MNKPHARHTLVRRLSILLVGLLVTAALGYGAWVLTPPQYTARALVLLLPSVQSLGQGGNPLLELGGLEQPAYLVVAHYQSATEKDVIQAVAPKADFAVSIEDSTKGPVIAVDIDSPDARTTMTALYFLIADIPTTLQDLQTAVDAPDVSLVRSINLTVDQKATTDWSITIRIAIAAIVIGLVLTAIAEAVVERRIARRRVEVDEEDEEPVRVGRAANGRRARLPHGASSGQPLS